MSPAEAMSNSWAAAKLLIIMTPPAEAARLLVYNTVNLALSPDRWIEPDLTVLHRVPEPTDDDGYWVPAADCTMPVEIISRSSERRDRIDKPALCAEAGIGYFMQVKVVRRLRHVSVDVLRLNANGSHATIASAIAIAGQTLRMTEPFSLEFDPAQLLEP